VKWFFGMDLIPAWLRGQRSVTQERRQRAALQKGKPDEFSGFGQHSPSFKVPANGKLFHPGEHR
jgi:hypothetical protein